MTLTLYTVIADGLTVDDARSRGWITVDDIDAANALSTMLTTDGATGVTVVAAVVHVPSWIAQ